MKRRCRERLKHGLPKTLILEFGAAARTAGARARIGLNSSCIAAFFLPVAKASAQMPEGCWPWSGATQFAGVTGDGKAAAIAVNYVGITVLPSNGTMFLPNETWTSGPYYGNMGTYFADVTGGGKAEAIVVNTSGITVRPSNGGEFLPNELWMTSSSSYLPANGCATYFAEVNGDGKADADFVRASDVLASLSTGGPFSPPSHWTLNPYYGNVGTYFADVTGNSLADAIAVNTTGVTVSLSNGNLFGPSETWTSNPYYAGTSTTLGFTGTLSNLTAADEFLNGALSYLNQSMTVDPSPFFNFAPLFLAGGASFNGPFLTLTSILQLHPVLTPEHSLSKAASIVTHLTI
jgi:hypothetical protein